MANGSSREIVDILQCGEGSDLTDDSGKQACRLLGEVSVKHKLACELREVCFDTLSGLCKGDEGWLPIFLVESVRDLQTDVGRFEKIQLQGRADIAAVSEDAAVVVFIFDILQIIDVVHVRLGDVEGVDDSAEPADGVQLVSVVVGVLRRTEAKGWCCLVVGLPESAS